ncbi:AEC family transporter [Glutamicibacter sp. JL.03c]|uniref:AEC family transporter n=1 Tax=Glutamicibacter sp. JL.03c TaxID=2984842 RepID=UPI0021F797B3|nr:AEC family transporter [Glutamicibacter sp. JL.03c]UYQ77545.1 AEC family transporter [Glutamicibacter sp. JL.03c]
MFVDVLYGVLPLFFIMLIGYGTSYAPKFPASVEPALNVFVFYVALPALLYKVVARADISQGVPFSFLWISIAATLLFAGLSWILFRYLLRVGKARALAGMLTTSFGNVSYLGIPVILGVMGPQAGFAAGMGQLVHNIIFMVGFPILAQIMLPAGAGAGQHPASGSRLSRTIRNALLYSPVTWAMVIGGAVVLSGIRVPDPIDDTIDLLSAAAAPGALFVIGMSLKRTIERSRAARNAPVKSATAPAARAKSSMLAMIIGKLVALPLLTVLMLQLFAPGLDRVWFNAAVLMAAMPVSATAYIMAHNDTGDGEPTAVAIVITCLLSVIALPVLAQLVLK